MAEGSYLVLARKWRPQTFTDVIGQEHITRTLQNSLRSGRIGHAYLFIGTRGVGKTTTARILAKALNCLSVDTPTPEPCGTCPNCVGIASGNHIDVAEIDGASNNGVENVREIRDHIRLVPVSSRYKIYIIDEVHQLSLGAFNALLKTLEEPPAHAVFILATTESHKVPATIISRCQRYDFRRVAQQVISDLLRHILDSENVSCTEEALYAIARAADGSVRDGESILEQVISYAGDTIEYKDVFDVLGLVDWRVYHDLCDAVLEKDIAAQLSLIEQVFSDGKDLSQFVQDILHYLRHLLVCKTANPDGLVALPDEELVAMKSRADRFTLMALIRLIEQFAELTRDFDSRLAQRIALESLLIRVSKVTVEASLDEVLEKLAALGAGGVAYPGPLEEPEVNPNGAALRARSTHVATPPQDLTPTPIPSRHVLTEQNMKALWKQITHQISSSSLQLGIALGYAQPVAIEENTLIIEYPPHLSNNTALLDVENNYATLKDTMTSHVNNIRDVRAIVGKELETVKEERSPQGPFSSMVKAEDAIQALQNVHVADTVDVFKGLIVDIKHR